MAKFVYGRTKQSNYNKSENHMTKFVYGRTKQSNYNKNEKSHGPVRLWSYTAKESKQRLKISKSHLRPFEQTRNNGRYFEDVLIEPYGMKLMKL